MCLRLLFRSQSPVSLLRSRIVRSASRPLSLPRENFARGAASPQNQGRTLRPFCVSRISVTYAKYAPSSSHLKERTRGPRKVPEQALRARTLYGVSSHPLIAFGQSDQGERPARNPSSERHGKHMFKRRLKRDESPSRGFGGLRTVTERWREFYARRFRPSPPVRYAQARMSEFRTIAFHCAYGEYPLSSTKRNLKRTALSVSRFRFFLFVICSPQCFWDTTEPLVHSSIYHVAESIRQPDKRLTLKGSFAKILLIEC